MIVVLDTNVIISALLSSTGAPAEILSRWENNEFEVEVSTQLLAELGRALHYPKIARYLKLSDEEIGRFLRRYVASATLIILKKTWRRSRRIRTITGYWSVRSMPMRLLS